MGKKKLAGNFFRKIKKIKIRFFLPKNLQYLPNPPCVAIWGTPYTYPIPSQKIVA